MEMMGSTYKASCDSPSEIVVAELLFVLKQCDIIQLAYLLINND